MRLENVKITSANVYTPGKPYPDHKIERDVYRVTVAYDENTHLDLPVKTSRFYSFRSAYGAIVTLRQEHEYAKFNLMLQIADIRNLGRDIVFRGATVDLEVMETQSYIGYRDEMASHFAVKEIIIRQLDNLNDPIKWQTQNIA